MSQAVISLTSRCVDGQTQGSRAGSKGGWRRIGPSPQAAHSRRTHAIVNPAGHASRNGTRKSSEQQVTHAIDGEET
jgi:hypothetical protein